MLLVLAIFGLFVDAAAPDKIVMGNCTSVKNKRCFVNAADGTEFTVRGNNYIRLGSIQGKGPNKHADYHSTFNIGLYNASEANLALAHMRSLGYNFARVFIDTGTSERTTGINGNGSEWASSAYIANLGDFLSMAAAHSIYVQVQVNSELPVNAYWAKDLHRRGGVLWWAAWPNQIFLAPAYVEAFAAFVAKIGTALNTHLLGDAKNAWFSLSIQNEATMTVDALPFSSLTPLTVKTADGVTYNLTSDAERQQCVDANYAHFANTAAQAFFNSFGGEDKSPLVTMGMYTFAAVSKSNGPNGVRSCGSKCDPRYPPRPVTLALYTNLSYLDIHVYPHWSRPDVTDLEADLNSSSILEVDTHRTCLLMGEFGAFKTFFKTALDAAVALVAMQTEICHKMSSVFAGGFSLWTWDTWEQPFIWNAVDANDTIAAALSPKQRPSPCHSNA